MTSVTVALSIVDIFNTCPTFFAVINPVYSVKPSVPRKSLSMQDMVGGDYFRTPVKFQGSDNLVFVGDVTSIEKRFSVIYTEISKSMCC